MEHIENNKTNEINASLISKDYSNMQAPQTEAANLNQKTIFNKIFFHWVYDMMKVRLTHKQITRNLKEAKLPLRLTPGSLLQITKNLLMLRFRR